MTGGGTGGDAAAYAPPPYAGGAVQPPASAGPAGYPPPPLPPRRPPGRLRTALASAGILLAIVLSAAALVVALTKDSSAPAHSTTVNAAAEPTASTPTPEADRELCTAIAPLMSEYDDVAKTWFALGAPGTPARDGALPKFVEDTKSWVTRAEAVLADHPDAQPRFHRTLERHLDDLWLYVHNIAPGPQETYDHAAWTDSLVAYGGPLKICQALGIRWG